MVLDIHDKCADPSPRFTDTVRREAIGTRPNKASRIGGHITREYSLYIRAALQRSYGQRVCPRYLYGSVEWRKPVIPP